MTTGSSSCWKMSHSTGALKKSVSGKDLKRLLSYSWGIFLFIFLISVKERPHDTTHCFSTLCGKTQSRLCPTAHTALPFWPHKPANQVSKERGGKHTQLYKIRAFKWKWNVVSPQERAETVDLSLVWFCCSSLLVSEEETRPALPAHGFCPNRWQAFYRLGVRQGVDDCVPTTTVRVNRLHVSKRQTTTPLNVGADRLWRKLYISVICCIPLRRQAVPWNNGENCSVSHLYFLYQHVA